MEVNGGDYVAREIAKQFTLELALPTPEASPVQGELSAKLTEGLLIYHYNPGKYKSRSPIFKRPTWIYVGINFEEL